MKEDEYQETCEKISMEIYEEVNFIIEREMANTNIKKEHQLELTINSLLSIVCFHVINKLHEPEIIIDSLCENLKENIKHQLSIKKENLN